MRRWDRLLDAYIEEYGARGVSSQSIAYTKARLERWGRWLKGRRPRIGIGTPGPLEDQPIAVDERPEGDTVQSPTETD